jgi:hypothetical protein
MTGSAKERLASQLAFLLEVEIDAGDRLQPVLPGTLGGGP